MKIQPKRLITAGGTLLCALGIGYFMQSTSQPPAATKGQDAASAGMTANASAPAQQAVANGSVELNEITMTSAAPAIPMAPKPVVTIEPEVAPDPNTLPETVMAPDPAATPVSAAVPEAPMAPAVPVIQASLQDDTPVTEPDTAQIQPDLTCDYQLTATSEAAAMVRLNLSAPCMINERFTLHHNGMMISEVTDADGNGEYTLPALSENAVFIVAFSNGEGAFANVEVSSLEYYDRAVVQWSGDSGMQIHAREFGADYGSDGHVWVDAARDQSSAALGQGGFITRHGAADLDDALLAEVYTFPSGVMNRDGDVALSVEAEVTQANCGRDVEAQSIQKTADGSLKSQDLVLAMPECNAIGDFLVLKNMLNDLKIAAK